MKTYEIMLIHLFSLIPTLNLTPSHDLWHSSALFSFNHIYGHTSPSHAHTHTHRTNSDTQQKPRLTPQTYSFIFIITKKTKATTVQIRAFISAHTELLPLPHHWQERIFSAWAPQWPSILLVCSHCLPNNCSPQGRGPEPMSYLSLSPQAPLPHWGN